jgi:hypothetical protein
MVAFSPEVPGAVVVSETTTTTITTTISAHGIIMVDTRHTEASACAHTDVLLLPLCAGKS